MKRCCVIGAGASGLTSMKSCLEAGFQVVCYEKTNDIGGLWKYRENSIEGVASVAKSTIINTSKEMSAFSDFPPPKEFANFMHNTFIMLYLEGYAENFNLMPHLRFQHEVVSIKQNESYAATGRWDVVVKNLKSGDEIFETFDAVMVCSGHHSYPSVPDIPGWSTFKGSTSHSHTYKTPYSYEDKRVVIIGIGNSGGDAAAELSKHCKTVYLSTRRGSWIMSRFDEGGWPLDMTLNSRFVIFLQRFCGWKLSNDYLEGKATFRFDHDLYGLKPNHRMLSQHAMVNDDLPNRIAAGTVIVKGDVDHFTENGVVFKNETEIREVDVVLLATGYEIKFPFIPKDIVSMSDNNVKLYKFVFPAHLDHPTLAFIGLIQPLGCVFPISEMQARWAVQLFKGTCTLPSETSMEADIAKKQEFMSKFFTNSPRHTVQVDYVPYTDEIASLINARPPLLKLLVTNPTLFLKCYLGPCLPYQYRLAGPNPWPTAANAIVTSENRVVSPFMARESKVSARNFRLSTTTKYMANYAFVVGFYLAIAFFFCFEIFNFYFRFFPTTAC